MAAFRKSVAKIVENAGLATASSDEVPEVDTARYEMCTGCATDEEAEEDDEDDEADQVLGQELKAQGSTTLKRKKKAGRKSCWPEEAIDEIVNVVCENEYYRKKLIYEAYFPSFVSRRGKNWTSERRRRFLLINVASSAA
eukprot:gene6707-7469_t